jgi:protein-disulfide isomerase
VTKTLNTTEREPFLSRRVMLGAAVAATVGLLVSLWTSRGSRTETATRQRNKPKRTTADLMKPGPLADLSVGKADAPVTIVEYASMTCPHCAEFHNKVLPVLKEKYIDTGKVRLVFREFLLDERGALAAMVARCAGNERALPLISALFAKQNDWVPAKDDFLQKLYGYAQQMGVSRTEFDNCRNNQKLLKELVAQRDRGSDLGVRATPTFFVNGKRLAGATIEDFDKAIASVSTP